MFMGTPNAPPIVERYWNCLVIIENIPYKVGLHVNI